MHCFISTGVRRLTSAVFCLTLTHSALTGAHTHALHQRTQVGIYKTDNTTKSIAINPGLFTVGGGAKEPLAAPPVVAAS